LVVVDQDHNLCRELVLRLQVEAVVEALVQINTTAQFKLIALQVFHKPEEAAARDVLADPGLY
jgi:hypothetical protein